MDNITESSRIGAQDLPLTQTKRKRKERTEPSGKVAGKGKKIKGGSDNLEGVISKIVDDEITYASNAKRKKVGHVASVQADQFTDNRQQAAAGLETKRAGGFRGYGTLQVIKGEVRLVFGYMGWNGRVLDHLESGKLLKRMEEDGVLWMVWPMIIIAGADEINFASLTKDLSEAPFHAIELLDKAKQQGRLDSLAGQHRLEALKLMIKAWEAKIKDLEALVIRARKEGDSDQAADLELELTKWRKQTLENGRWVVAVFERECVDNELGLALSSNADEHRFKATELETVNGQLFKVVHAATPDQKVQAKITLLKNCKDLRICTVLNCPEFLDFLVEIYALPGLRSSEVFNDMAWVKSFLPVGRQCEGRSIIAGTLIHAFLIMRQLMVDISTHSATGKETTLPAVPEIWNAELLAQVNVIYDKTIGRLIAKDGTFTNDVCKAWSEYRLQIAQLMLRVFEDENKVLTISTPFSRACSSMHSNTLRLLPEVISENELPYPLLTNSVLRDFTRIFTKVAGGISMFVNIVEPLWGVPTDMDPHNKERFFDGSIVIHRHLDRLLVHGNETDKVNARTEIVKHLRLKRSTSFTRLQLLSEEVLLTQDKPDFGSPELKARWARAQEDLVSICKRPRNPETTVSILPSDSDTSLEIAALVGSIHAIRPNTLRMKDKHVELRTRDAIINTMNIVKRTEKLMQSSTYCEERKWFIAFLDGLGANTFTPWDRVPIPAIVIPENNDPAAMLKEAEERRSFRSYRTKWQKIADTIIKFPLAVDENRMLVPEVYQGIMLIHQGFMSNFETQRSRRLPEPNVNSQNRSTEKEWLLDLSAVLTPIAAALQGVGSSNLDSLADNVERSTDQRKAAGTEAESSSEDVNRPASSDANAPQNSSVDEQLETIVAELRPTSSLSAAVEQQMVPLPLVKAHSPSALSRTASKQANTPFTAVSTPTSGTLTNLHILDDSIQATTSMDANAALTCLILASKVGPGDNWVIEPITWVDQDESGVTRQDPYLERDDISSLNYLKDPGAEGTLLLIASHLARHIVSVIPCLLSLERHVGAYVKLAEELASWDEHFFDTPLQAFIEFNDPWHRKLAKYGLEHVRQYAASYGHDIEGEMNQDSMRGAANYVFGPLDRMPTTPSIQIMTSLQDKWPQSQSAFPISSDLLQSQVQQIADTAGGSFENDRSMEEKQRRSDGSCVKENLFIAPGATENATFRKTSLGDTAFADDCEHASSYPMADEWLPDLNYSMEPMVPQEDGIFTPVEEASLQGTAQQRELSLGAKIPDNLNSTGHGFNFALYQRAIATMIERLAKTAPNETCYPTMTVLAVEMAVWFTESLALRPLEPVMQFVKQSLSRDNTYPLFSSLFDNVIDTYGHFRDPIHLAITGALLKAVNNLVTPTPMNATDIDDALRAQHKLTTATIAAIFKEFPCSDTKPQCLFDAQRIRKLGAKAEMLIKSRKIQKASVTDLPSSDPIIEPGTHKRRATGAPSVNHRPVANVQNMVQPEKAKKASTTDIPSPKPIVAPGAKKPKTTGAPSATHRPALNQSLVKSNQEMADGSVKKARTAQLKLKRVIGPEDRRRP